MRLTHTLALAPTTDPDPNPNPNPNQGDVAVYYELPPQEQSSSRGIIEVDQ